MRSDDLPFGALIRRAVLYALLMLAAGGAVYLTLGVSTWSAILFAVACGIISSFMRA